LTVHLLDVNLLIALAWPSHIHHRDAHRWFGKNAQSGWATCPITEIGFVRISSNPKIIPEAVTPREALSVLREMRNHEKHSFWPDSISLVGQRHIPAGLLVGHRQVTDAYLVGLARKNGGKLATIDRGILDLVSAKSARQHVIELVPVGNG
jgi:uncharacterized protein